jgi:hypothetical protein
VGDAAGQLPDRLHLLRLPQLPLRPPQLLLRRQPVGHVPAVDHHRPDARVVQQVRACALHPPPRPVPVKGPVGRGVRAPRAFQQRAEEPLDLRPVVRVGQVGQPAADRLARPVAEDAGDGRAGVADRPAAVEQADRVVAPLHHRPEAGLAGTQVLLRPAAGPAALRLPQLPPDRRRQPGQPALEQEVGGPGPHQLRRPLLTAPAGHRQQRQVRVGPPDQLQGLGEIEPGRRVAGQDHVPAPAGQGVPQLGGGLHPRPIGGEAPAGQLPQHQLGVGRAGFDDQHAEGGGHGDSRPARAGGGRRERRGAGIRPAGTARASSSRRTHHRATRRGAI